MDALRYLACPLCRAQMQGDGKCICCTGTRRHSYDVAASGYVNLLPPGKQSNRKTGDDSEMLRSRRTFLSGGYYDKISESAANAALSALKECSYITFVDAGCGDGYHALNIAEFFQKAGIPSLAIGLEASKKGAEMASKLARKKGSNSFFAAANIFDMPLADRSCDCIFSMFAPVPDSEAARVLKDDGVIVVCSSGSRHLWEMREVIYGTPRLSPPLDRVPEGFERVSHTTLEYSFTLEEQELIAALFTMTPFYWRCPKDGREKLLSLDSLTLTCETEYNVYKKAHP